MPGVLVGKSSASIRWPPRRASDCHAGGIRRDRRGALMAGSARDGRGAGRLDCSARARILVMWVELVLFILVAAVILRPGQSVDREEEVLRALRRGAHFYREDDPYRPVRPTVRHTPDSIHGFEQYANE